MKPDQADQNLQVIRTLMERSTLYRRALGPIMLVAGIVAGSASLFGKLYLGDDIAFAGYWTAVCGVVVFGALLLTRRQALKDNEPFWSSPTRRVAVALLPPLVVGVVYTVTALVSSGSATLVAVWAMLYGCALHSAGFFAPRSLRSLGWLFILTGAALWFCHEFTNFAPSRHLSMGVIFGGLHLGCGAYLSVTEKRSNVS